MGLILLLRNIVLHINLAFCTGCGDHLGRGIANGILLRKLLAVFRNHLHPNGWFVQLILPDLNIPIGNGSCPDLFLAAIALWPPPSSLSGYES